MATALNKTEQRLFQIAASTGDLTQVRSLLARNPDVYFLDQNHFTPLMQAARSGHTHIVHALLPVCLQHPEASWLVQHAFEAAAEYGSPQVARLLVDVGADPRWAFIGMQDYWERCPICLARCCPGARRVCSHWICASDDMGLSWFLQDRLSFGYIVHELHAWITGNPQVIEQLESCPEQIRNVITQAHESGAYFWTTDSRVTATQWRSKDPLADTGHHYYTAHPEFIHELASTIREAIHWLQRRSA